MATSLLFSITFLLFVSFIISGGISNMTKEQKTWCIAKPATEEAKLQENIDYACSKVDCKVLQQGNACYTPNNLINHASIAMNLFYKANGAHPWNCYFADSALFVINDPSYGNCRYA